MKNGKPVWGRAATRPSRTTASGAGVATAAPPSLIIFGRLFQQRQPPLPEALEEVPQLAQRLGARPVEAARALAALVDQAGLGSHTPPPALPPPSAPATPRPHKHTLAPRAALLRSAPPASGLAAPPAPPPPPPVSGRLFQARQPPLPEALEEVPQLAQRLGARPVEGARALAALVGQAGL